VNILISKAIRINVVQQEYSDSKNSYNIIKDVNVSEPDCQKILK